ncbi:MAG: hypothetical protein C4321_11120, partial [Chloroflexota bacterium]
LRPFSTLQTGRCSATLARDAAGAAVPIWDAQARSFCLTGALERAGWDIADWSVPALCTARELVSAVLREEDPTAIRIPDWNDAPHRRQQDVLAVLDRAIALAQS